MRRGAGIGGLQKKAQVKQRYEDLGTELEAENEASVRHLFLDAHSLLHIYAYIALVCCVLSICYFNCCILAYVFGLSLLCLIDRLWGLFSHEIFPLCFAFRQRAPFFALLV